MCLQLQIESELGLRQKGIQMFLFYFFVVTGIIDISIFQELINDVMEYLESYC